VGYGLPSKQTVNAVGCRLQARSVQVGCRLWTLDGERTVQTVVTQVATTKFREVVDVVTDHLTFTVAPDQILGTPDGWMHARDTEGTVLAWTHARKLCRQRLAVRPGYELGYMIGASCADGTVGKNYVSLVVNDERFAVRFAACLSAATGLTAGVEAVTRPSGYLQRDAPGFRVRVVSSYLADLMRQYVGGDAHHMRQRFPRVVLRDRETFEGFLDGYTDGDGYRSRTWRGRLLVSANVPFLAELARVIGARFTPRRDGRASHLVVAESWPSRGTFDAEQHTLELRESEWAEVREVRLRRAESPKPFTLYSYRLDPYPSFLINGHLAREPW
jgi:GTP cyclohydrolase I